MCVFFQTGAPTLEQRMAAVAIDGTPAHKSIAAAGQSIRKTLDCQIFILSLFTKGRERERGAEWPLQRDLYSYGFRHTLSIQKNSTLVVCVVLWACLWRPDVAQVCQHLHLLESPLTDDVDTMIADAVSDQDSRTQRDFRSRVDTLALAYEPLSRRIVKAAESRPGAFSALALKDATKAETNANMLYAWARTFVPTSTNAQAKMDKAGKLQLMPYIVAMAYAVRIKLDVYYVESSGVDRAERLEYLERSRNTVDEFVAIVKTAVRITLHDSSLLDVALDYHLALTAYIALMAALRASVQMVLKPSDAPSTIALWDDGLDKIRSARQRA